MPKQTNTALGRAFIAGGALTGLAALSPRGLSAAEGGWDTLFAVDVGLMIWTILTFVSLLAALRVLAWKPLLGMLDAREQSIRDAIRESERLQAEAEQLASEHRMQLAEARREAQAIVAEGRDAAQKVRADIEEKARVEGAAMVERALREIDREKTAALESLRKESVELALSAASRLIDRNLDAAADRSLVVDYLAKLGDRGAEA